VTPILLLAVFAAAYGVRPYVTNETTRRYFLPALSLRILGALMLGVVYQYYYKGGDTFNYHTQGSRIIWEAFWDDPLIGLRMIFGSVSSEQNIYEYSSRILFFHDPNSYFVIRIAALFDLLTFSSYSGTAILFSVFSFTGMWMLFQTFYKYYPAYHLGLVLATCFVPSVFFWGSGVLKDTVVVACVGMATYYISEVLIDRKVRLNSILLLLGLLYVVFKVRVFVLQAFLPAVIIWILAYNYNSIRSGWMRLALVPFMAVILLVSVYFTVNKIGETNAKYSIANLASTSRITAFDIGFYTGRDAGSGYRLAVTDWTPLGMLQAAPAAINVSLFRPYLWEIKNPLMFVSSLESAFIMLFTLIVFFRNIRHLAAALSNPHVIFCFSFSLAFAFAVGISTFNFGTLVRYKIPLLPFFLIGLVIMNSYSNKARYAGSMASTE
jgi:hypothetical protein